MKNILTCLLCFFLLISCTENDASPESFNNLSSDDSVIDAIGNMYEVGFEQVSGNNQNPFVLKRDVNGTVLWKINHEETPVDCRAKLIAINGSGRVYAVFSVDGGSNENTYITKHQIEANAFDNVYLNSYGSGGGPKVSVLTEINPDNGKIIKGTFLIARLSNGSTNSLSIDGMGFNETGILLESTSAAWPPGAGTNYQRYPNITDEDRIDGFFKVNYIVDYNLSEILLAEIQ